MDRKLFNFLKDIKESDLGRDIPDDVKGNIENASKKMQNDVGDILLEFAGKSNKVITKGLKHEKRKQDWVLSNPGVEFPAEITDRESDLNEMLNDLISDTSLMLSIAHLKPILSISMEHASRDAKEKESPEQ